MRLSRAFWIAAIASLLAAIPGFGHHSFKAQYDENQTIMLTGTVSKVTWTNPHVLVYLDVKDGEDKVTSWELELASPNGLLSQGWKVDSLRPGSHISISGYPARDGSHIANARKVTLATR
jgi:hypothetical protein